MADGAKERPAVGSEPGSGDPDSRAALGQLFRVAKDEARDRIKSPVDPLGNTIKPFLALATPRGVVVASPTPLPSSAEARARFYAKDMPDMIAEQQARAACYCSSAFFTTAPEGPQRQPVVVIWGTDGEWQATQQAAVNKADDGTSFLGEFEDVTVGEEATMSGPALTGLLSGLQRVE